MPRAQPGPPTDRFSVNGGGITIGQPYGMTSSVRIEPREWSVRPRCIRDWRTTGHRIASGSWIAASAIESGWQAPPTGAILMPTDQEPLWRVLASHRRTKANVRTKIRGK